MDFDIDRYLATNPATFVWLVNQHAADIMPADQVFIWRAIGGGGEGENGQSIRGDALEEGLKAADSNRNAAASFAVNALPIVRQI